MIKLSLAHVEALAKMVKDIRPLTLPPWVLTMPYADDWQSRYYRLLHVMAQASQPELIVELGTDKGTSAVHLATGCPQAQVITIDNDHNVTAALRKFAGIVGLKNLYAHYGGSGDRETLQLVKSYGKKIGLLFIDTTHTFEHASGEYNLYVPLVEDGGLVAHDDVTISDDMKKYWDFIPSQKILLPEMHHSGFGVSIR